MPDLNLAAARMVTLHEAQEHGLAILEDTDSCIALATGFGILQFDAIEQGARAHVAAAKSDWLYMLKESLIGICTNAGQSLTGEALHQPRGDSHGRICRIAPCGKRIGLRRLDRRTAGLETRPA